MVKADIVNELRKLDDIGVSRKSYMITYDAAMVLYGIKACADAIDVIGNEECIMRLTHLGYRPQQYHGPRPAYCFVISEDIYVLVGIRLRAYRGQWIDGCHVLSQSGLLNELTIRNLEEDRNNVDSIHMWRKTHGLSKLSSMTAKFTLYRILRSRIK